MLEMPRLPSTIDVKRNQPCEAPDSVTYFDSTGSQIQSDDFGVNSLADSAANKLLPNPRSLLIAQGNTISIDNASLLVQTYPFEVQSFSGVLRDFSDPVFNSGANCLYTGYIAQQLASAYSEEWSDITRDSLLDLINQSQTFSGVDFAALSAPQPTPYILIDSDSFRADSIPEQSSVLLDVVDIRLAFKLGAKFFQHKQIQFGDKLVSLCEHAFDVGLILLLAGERRDLVVAGILHNSFAVPLEKDSAHVKSTVERKFGSRVVSMIDSVTVKPVDPAEPWSWISGQFEALDKLRDGDRDGATLACAIKLDLLSTGNMLLAQCGCPKEPGTQSEVFQKWTGGADPKFIVASLMRYFQEFQRHGVSIPLLDQFRLEAAKFSESLVGRAPDLFLQPLEDQAAMGSGGTFRLAGNDMTDIRRAAELSSYYFESVPRSWGPFEKIPLSMHEFEVGTLLALAGESRDVIIAGLLHDLFEGYFKVDDQSGIRTQVEGLFGPRVMQLIDAVTEPPKSETFGNWWERKLHVLYNIASMDRDVASVACAAKISTLAAGNKMLYMKQPISRWSSGTIEDNASVFRRYLELFREKGVSPILLGQLELELNRFESHLPAESAGHEISASA